MRYLPHNPRNFSEIVLADLLRAQRLILRIQDEIDPQFRPVLTTLTNSLQVSKSRLQFHEVSYE